MDIIFKSLLAKIDFITSEKAVVEGEIHDITSQKEELEMKITNLQTEAERSLAQVKADSDATLYDLLCKSMMFRVKIKYCLWQLLEK